MTGSLTATETAVSTPTRSSSTSSLCYCWSHLRTAESVSEIVGSVYLLVIIIIIIIIIIKEIKKRRRKKNWGFRVALKK